MKKTIFLLLMFPLLFIACGSDDDDDEPKQDYTSFVFMQPYIVVQKNVIVAYKKDNKYIKVAELGDLKKNEYSREIKITDKSIKELYIFSDYPSASTLLDAVFKLKDNIKNIFIPAEDTKGLDVIDKTDPTQYPQ